MAQGRSGGEVFSVRRIRFGDFRAEKAEQMSASISIRWELDGIFAYHNGWHAFRRGLATNLHALGVDDKTIQAILRHSSIGLAMNVYVKFRE